MADPSEEKKGTVEENVSNELKALGNEIKSVADDVRQRISAAGEEAKKTWSNLDAERKRFFDKVEQAAEETRADLRQMGADLKRRLQGLQEQIKPGASEENEGGPSGESSG